MVNRMNIFFQALLQLKHLSYYRLTKVLISRTRTSKGKDPQKKHRLGTVSDNLVGADSNTYSMVIGIECRRLASIKYHVITVLIKHFQYISISS